MQQCAISINRRLVWGLGAGLVLLLLAGSGIPAAAQGAPTGTVAEPTPEGAPADTNAGARNQAEPPEHLASPRATVRTFLEAFYVDDGADLEMAASCLDLGEIHPNVRTMRGQEVAARLKDLLDRTALIDIEKIPIRPEEDRWQVLRTDAGRVMLARQDDGRWLFDRQTVRDVDAMFREVETRKVVEGVERTAPEVVTPAMWLRSKVSPRLHRPVLFLELWQWIGILVVIVLGVLVERVLSALLQGAVLRGLRRRLDVVDPTKLAWALRPVGIVMMVLVWGLGIVWLGLPVTVLNLYVRAVWVVGVLAAVITAYRLVDVLTYVLEVRAARTESRFDDLLVPLIRKSLKIFVVAVGIVLVAENLWGDVTGLLAGLGLGGLAFALAAQDTVSNLFGSFTVLLDRPFQVGDWVVVGDVEGTVEEVGFRSTRIRTFYSSLITLPNSNLTNAAVDNLGQRAYRRWSTRLGLTYDTPPERIDAFCEGVRELILTHPYTRKDYYHVYFNEFGPACLEVMLYVFFVAPDWATELRERHRLAVDIMRVARAVGVEFAFPTSTVYLRREDWTAPEPVGDGYDAGGRRLEGEAREAARRLVRESLGDKVPPPVSFVQPAASSGPDESRP